MVGGSVWIYENAYAYPPVRRHVYSRQPAARALPQSELALVHRVRWFQPAAIVAHEFLSTGNRVEKVWPGRPVLRQPEKV